MNTYREEIFNIVDKLCSQYAIKGRDYYQGFRKRWYMAFERAFALDTSYLPENSDAVLEVTHSFEDCSFTFHFVRYEDCPPAAQEKAIAEAKAMEEQ